MVNDLSLLERVARQAFRFSTVPTQNPETVHPFEERNIHPFLPDVVRKLFDNAHYAQATFEAFKFLDKEVARLAGQHESGSKLMLAVFSEDTPILMLTPCVTVSEKDEQKGFRFLFTGSILAIRNPRGHEYGVIDSVDTCLDHLAVASLLLRRLEAANFTISAPKPKHSS